MKKCNTCKHVDCWTKGINGCWTQGMDCLLTKTPCPESGTCPEWKLSRRVAREILIHRDIIEELGMEAIEKAAEEKED